MCAISTCVHVHLAMNSGTKSNLFCNGTEQYNILHLETRSYTFTAIYSSNVCVLHHLPSILATGAVSTLIGLALAYVYISINGW